MATTTEFYKIFNINPNDQTPSINTSFQQLVGQNPSFCHDYDRDLHATTLLSNGNIGSILRKIRTDEQIEIGQAGVAGTYINFIAGQGKIENNPFVYFPQYDVIGYIRNTHGSYHSRLAQCLREVFGRNIGITPLITKSSIQAMLAHKHVVKLNCSIPVSPQLAHSGGDWGSNTIRSLASSGADIVEFSARIDLRRDDHGFLDSAVNTAYNLLEMGAVKLRAVTEDMDGKHDYLDLIADKIIHVDENFTYAKERITATDIYSKINDAYLSKLDEIQKIH